MSTFLKASNFIVLHTSASTIQFSSSLPSSLNPQDFHIIRASGIFLHESFQESLEFSSYWHHDIDLSQAADAMGEWSALAEKKNGSYREYVALSDSYGYGPLFYAVVPGKCVVLSDSFGGASAGLESLGIRRSLNLSNYAVVMPNWVGGFIGPFGANSMANEINILGVREMLYITENQVFISDRHTIGASAEVKSESEALDRGINYVSKVLVSLSDNNSWERRIKLSGGGDSRIVLGLLTAAGIHGKFKVQAHDPRGFIGYSKKVFGRDIEIADALRSRLGMQWCSPEPRQLFRVDFRESLNHFLGYRSNIGYDFSPSSLRSISTIPVLTLIGGGGEIIRTSNAAREYASQIQSLGPGPELGSSGQNLLVGKWMTDKLQIADPFREQSVDFVSNVFSNLEGESLWERFYNHYFVTRNRAHFGHARYSQSYNIPVVHPISNSYFLAANRFVDFESRAREEIMRKILVKTNPDLCNIEFSDDSTTNAVSGKLVQRISSTNAWERDFDQVQSLKSEKVDLDEFGILNRGVFADYDPRQSSLNFLKMAFSEIQSIHSGDEREAITAQNKLLMRGVKNNTLNLNWMVGKAASALEVFYPSGGSSNRIDFYCMDQKLSPSLSESVTIAIPSIRNDGWNNLPIIELNPKLTKESQGFSAKLNPPPSLASKYEYACYLMQDGKCVINAPYQPEPNFLFNSVIEDGNYHAIGFARPRGQKAPVAQINSDTLRLEK